jgi:hypothetical protein
MQFVIYALRGMDRPAQQIADSSYKFGASNLSKSLSATP